MSTQVRVVVPEPPEAQALTLACQEVASQWSLDKFEIAVKSRLEHGINDDCELRLTDDLLHQVVLGSDAMEAVVTPPISAAHALHKTLLDTAKPWRNKWAALVASLKAAIIRYDIEQKAIKAKQQRELERAAEEERRRKEAEVRAAMRSGDVAAAKQAMEEVKAVVTPVIMTATPVLEHSSGREPWQVEITDSLAVARGIAFPANLAQIINGALRSTIDAHGPITAEHIGSACKLIIGAMVAEDAPAGIVPVSAIKEFDLGLLKKEATRRGGLDGWPGMRAWQGRSLAVRR